MKQVFTIKEPTGSIKDAGELFKRIKKINIDYSQENFLIICLNTSNQIIDSKILFKGGLDACLLDARTIFRYALLNNSSKIIIAHNHPSGNLKHSYEDNEVFRKLKESGKVLEIQVLDSVIFNKKEFYSTLGEDNDN